MASQAAIHKMKVENAVATLEWMSQQKAPTKGKAQEFMPAGVPMDMDDDGFVNPMAGGPVKVQSMALNMKRPMVEHAPTGGALPGVVPGPMSLLQLAGPLKDKALALQIPIVDFFGLTMDGLTNWSKWNRETINHAKARQVFGGKDDIDWQTAFLPFMESIVMYMRDVTLHKRACDKYKDYVQARDGDDTAQSHLDMMKQDAVDDFIESTRNIQEIANLWDMDFQVLCNLPGHHPEGQPDWDGPFCGLFTSRKNDPHTGRPFQGIAFKGTNPISPQQWLVDFNYQESGAITDDFLKGTNVSLGVRTSLFGQYDNPELAAFGGVPYNRIRDRALASAAVLSRAAGGVPTVTHVTGHSLGASYATLCTAQLLLDMTATPGSLDAPLQMGDTYTFGSPRVGGNAWASWYQALVDKSRGRTWRIVNSRDLVPTVPPTSLKAALLDFHHVDGGIQVFPHRMLLARVLMGGNKKPLRLPSEINEPNPPAVAFDSVTSLVMDVAESIDHCKSFFGMR